MKYDDELDFLELHQIAFDRVLFAMTKSGRAKVEEKSDKDHKYVTDNWVGYGLLAYANHIYPEKHEQSEKDRLDDILETNGLASGMSTVRTLPSGRSAFTRKKSKAIFESLAEFQDIPLLSCFLNFLTFLKASPQILSIFPLSILKGSEKFDVSLDELIADIDRHIKMNKIEFSKAQKLQKTQAPRPDQPRLTIPQPRAGNENYYANTALEIVGRQKEKEILEAFLLKCDLNVAWFQLAGVAGQGKSRLAFELVHLSIALGWTAGFLRENDINFFKDKWAQWQPDKPHLLVFDYVLGREDQIKPIIQTLIYRKEELQHSVRILLLERQPWSQGAVFRITGSEINEPNFSMEESNRANWFLKLCEMDDCEGENILENSFEDGVIELKNLMEDDLLDIVKQLSGEKIPLSDEEVKKTLKRIDDAGRPLYAYLLAQQINEDLSNFGRWTKTDLLYGQLKRDKHRWQKAFPQGAPTWGDSDPAMQLAVLASIVRSVGLADEKIRQHFGTIDSTLGNQALAIITGNVNGSDFKPTEICSIEPDLLGEWFVLFCCKKGLEYKEVLNLAWLYAPKQAAEFLLRISFDFPDEEVTAQLLNHAPPDEKASNFLRRISSQVIANLHYAKKPYPNEILECLKKEAESGDQRSLNQLGYLFFMGECVEKSEIDAFRLWMQSAGKGSRTAMYALGSCFMEGVGVDQNIERAVELYREAGDAGEANAMGALGSCYLDGYGVEQNLVEAVNWYIKGAKAGSGFSMANLGVCFQKGIGVERNLKRAVDCFVQGIKAGSGLATTHLGICYQCGLGVDKDLNKAFELHRKGAEEGDGFAMANIGACYYNGWGISQDFDKAVEWFQKGVQAKNGFAMSHLGNCYANGHGVPQDLEKAIGLFRKGTGTRNGGGHAMSNLGISYLLGRGVNKDFEEAVRWFQKGAVARDPYAMSNLAACYQAGVGVNQDIEKALYWYKKSADLGSEEAKKLILELKKTAHFFKRSADADDNSKQAWADIQLVNLEPGKWSVPPVIPGKWRSPNEQEARSVLIRIKEAVSAADLPQLLDGVTIRRLRMLSLKFYPGHTLVEAEVNQLEDASPIFFAVIVNASSGVLLSGNSVMIHALNRQILNLTDKESVLNYLKFFCVFIQDAGVTFQIISDLNEMVLAGSGAELPSEVKDAFFPVVHVGGALKQDGWESYKVCVLHENTLYNVVLKLLPNGMVEMSEDQALVENLPILRRIYDKNFYSYQ